jgi:hypothetical protein
MGIHEERVFPIKLASATKNKKKKKMGYEKNNAETTSKEKL